MKEEQQEQSPKTLDSAEMETRPQHSKNSNTASEPIMTLTLLKTPTPTESAFQYIPLQPPHTTNQ
jgi:hypothetical protein